LIEKKFEFTQTDRKLIEKIVEDDNLEINHVILPKGEALPEHYANSYFYILAVRGEITLRLIRRTSPPVPIPPVVLLIFPIKLKWMFLTKMKKYWNFL
jgi:hypothetical protein